MKLEFFRGVVWPRQEEHATLPQYRYVIVGLLITDQPIKSVSRPSNMKIHECRISQQLYGMSDVLEGAVPVPGRGALGDASDVLVSLNRDDLWTPDPWPELNDT